ncbi:MAG: RICIN domain-containing protein [Actinomycetales bacterium]
MRKSRTMAFGVTAACAAVTFGLCVIPAAEAAPSSNTLVVAANQTIKPVTHVASGALYGLSANGTPNQRFVAPLKPSEFVQMAAGGHQLPNGEPGPAGDTLVVAPEAAAVGAKVVMRMPDWYPGFPYGWVSWSDWLSAVDSQVKAVHDSGQTNISAFALWNEPDWTWDTAKAGSFNDGWVKTYNEVRSLDKTTPIQGPSYSDNISGMQSFLANAVATNTVPDIIAWHELESSSRIQGDIQTVTNIETSLGITPRPIDIEEYATPSEMGVPGALVGYISKFERYGVHNAELAFWNHYGTMGDTLVDTGGLPNASWWLYRWYGDMSGNMVSTTPPASTGLDGAASVNAAGNQVSVIFGGGTGAAAVTVNGLSAYSAFGSSAHVVLQQVISRGRTTAVSAPATVTVGDFPISNGSITVPVNAMNAGNGYHLVVTPTGSAPATLEGDYKLQNVNSGLTLGVQGASTSAGAAAQQSSDNGARDRQWNLVADGNGAYKVVNDNSGLVLDVQNSSTSAGAAVIQAADNGGKSQLWSAVSAGNGQFKLVNTNSGLDLGILNASTSAGATALQWTDNGTADHLWKLISTTSVAPGASYTIANVNSGLDLDTAGGGTTAGTFVQQVTANNAADQKWNFVDAGNGEYKIKNAASGLILGVQSASTSDGAAALIWGDNGTADHLWQVEPNGDGSYLIANANSGKVLGVSQMSTSSGAQVLQWDDSGTADHLWRIVQQ